MGQPGQIDLNQAGADDLARITGLGHRRAEKIVAFRNRHGAFTGVEEVNAIPDMEPLSKDILHALTVRHPPEREKDERERARGERTPGP